MTTLQVIIRVTDGKMEIENPAPASLPNGFHTAVLAINDAVLESPPSTASLFDLLIPMRVAGWPADSTFSREDLYDDTGR